MRRRIKAILIAIGLLISSAAILTAVTGTIPAHATSCASGNFHLQDIADSSLYVDSNGHNQQVTLETGVAATYCLVNSGTSGWYEFQFVNTNECLNVGTDKTIYQDSCIDSTPEQFNQSIPGDHHWENRHYGTNGIMTSLCNISGTPLDVEASNSQGCAIEVNQSFATPSA